MTPCSTSCISLQRSHLQGSHKGWYSISDECFYTDNQIERLPSPGGRHTSRRLGRSLSPRKPDPWLNGRKRITTNFVCRTSVIPCSRGTSRNPMRSIPHSSMPTF
ncbi:hypothetical protein BC826DRAFT_200703 [Russula brevipes]|nr:hypothetical protein BC826DRAFT_200703 [Russula brevipes]